MVIIKEEFDKETPEEKWYYSNLGMIVLLLSAGPLVLPLVWLHPRYKIISKILLTIATVIGTILCYILTKKLWAYFLEQLDEIKRLL